MLSTVNNLTINNTGTGSNNAVAFSQAETVNGNLTITSGNLKTMSLNLFLNGNFTNSGTFTADNSAITIGGTTAQSIAGFTTTGTVSITKTGGVATFSGNVNGGGLTINGSGGTLNLGSGLTHSFTGVFAMTSGALNCGSSTLQIGGNVTGNGATFMAGTGTVVYNENGPGIQLMGDFDYKNLTLTAAVADNKNWTPSTARTINGNLTINNGAIFVLVGGQTINIKGNWLGSLNSGFTSGNGTVIFNGSSAQTLSGPETFYNLTLNNPNGLTITGNNNETVSNLLTLTNGKITMPAGSNLVVSNTSDSAISGFNSSNYIVGTLQKSFATSNDQSFTFPVGDSANYAPVDLSSLNVTTAGSLGITSYVVMIPAYCNFQH